MDVSRRGFFAAAGAAGLTAGCSAMSAAGARLAPAGATSFAFGRPKNSLRVNVPGLENGPRVFVIGDTHFGFRDERDAAYADNYRRMGQWGAKKEPFEKMLAQAKKEKPDLLLLVGDNISFPTLANVEYLTAQLQGCGIPWHYVAGNHDWHFEGLPGSDEAQRAEWAPKRLAPLYQGRDPFMSSQVVKGVRFVAIDNSIYHVNAAQLDFWNREAAKGEPVVLFMHIPMWLPGWGFFTCGCPEWGAAVDPYWEIERREKWAARQSETTFAFREAVLSTPNLAAVFTGHHHATLVGTERGKFIFSVPGNSKGDFFDVRFGAQA